MFNQIKSFSRLENNRTGQVLILPPYPVVPTTDNGFMSWLKTKSEVILVSLSLITIFSIATFTRLYNLNYNSAFNDEAIYIVIGRLGIFQWDWWSYNAGAWMAGYPYVYPSLSALAYITGGVLASRFLNVIFGILSVELVFILALSLKPRRSTEALVSGLIAASLVASSSIALYISRLATYDMPSFYFLLLSLVLLLHAQKPGQVSGKWYFLACLSLVVAFFCKLIIGIYIPFILAYSYIQAKSLGQNYFYYWSRYFVVPIGLTISLYLATNITSIIAYAKVPLLKEKATLETMINMVWTNISYLLPLWLLGSFGMIWQKDYKKWLLITMMAVLILMPNFIFLKGEYTMEKHLFLTAVAFSIIIGNGLASLLVKFTNPVSKATAFSILIIILGFYAQLSYNQAQRFNVMWDNNNQMLAALNNVVKNNDKVLTEVGAGAILATYDKNYPTNTITFDWLEYNGLKGDDAYAKAVNDGYFNYIELERETRPEDNSHSRLHNLIKKNLADTYQPIYNQDGYVIYKRRF